MCIFSVPERQRSAGRDRCGGSHRILPRLDPRTNCHCVRRTSACRTVSVRLRSVHGVAGRHDIRPWAGRRIGARLDGQLSGDVQPPDRRAGGLCAALVAGDSGRSVDEATTEESQTSGMGSASCVLSRCAPSVMIVWNEVQYG